MLVVVAVVVMLTAVAQVVLVVQVAEALEVMRPEQVRPTLAVVVVARKLMQ